MARRKGRGEIREPKIRWGGRWLIGEGVDGAGGGGAGSKLAGLAALERDGEWHDVAVYGPTSAYQVARSLNLASALPPGKYRFASQVREGAGEDGEDVSVLMARRIG